MKRIYDYELVPNYEHIVNGESTFVPEHYIITLAYEHDGIREIPEIIAECSTLDECMEFISRQIHLTEMLCR